MTDPAPFSACRPAFARHRGYAPQYGWLLRVHEALLRDPAVGRHPDATVELATGSSKVPSMLFWSQAFGLSEPAPDLGPGALRPTARGTWLLDQEAGADPYLELPETLWLLHHWLLTAVPCRVPTWHYMFGCLGISQLSRAQLIERVLQACDDSGWQRPAPSSIERDISSLVAMYGPKHGNGKQESLEDQILHPFRQLWLLDLAGGDSRNGEARQLVLQPWAGRHAPAGVVLYAALEYASRSGAEGAGVVSLDRLSCDPFGPGRVLRIDRGSLRGALKRAVQDHAALCAVVEDGIGQEHLSFRRAPRVIAGDVLASLYRLPSTA